MLDSHSQYIGGELEIFAHALNWKAYWSRTIRPWVRGSVMEVGAGLGINTPFLLDSGVSSCLCLEPDARLAGSLTRAITNLPQCQVQVGTTSSITTQRFDSLVYIDVLEHIEDDRSELERAASLLNPGGSIVVLSPAYQFLYSPFDASIGHYRRYNRASLLACQPAGCRLEKLVFLDSIGLCTSLANRLLLRQALPSKSQILLWDRRLIPLSRLADPLIGYCCGRSILGVWVRS